MTEPTKPADPMDTPLPCAVTVGHGTIGKGVPLRTLVDRMQLLHEMATGQLTYSLTGPELNHLRRLIGWVRCEVGQSPDEMVPMVQGIVRQIGDVSQDGKARLVQAHAESSNVPKYVRAAVKALEKTISTKPEAGIPASAPQPDCRTCRRYVFGGLCGIMCNPSPCVNASEYLQRSPLQLWRKE